MFSSIWWDPSRHIMSSHCLLDQWKPNEYSFNPNSHTTIFLFQFFEFDNTAASVASWDSRLPAGYTLQNLSRCIVSSGYCFPCMINTDKENRIFRHPHPFCILNHRKANACCIFPQSSFLQLGELERSLEKMSTELSRHAVSCLWEQALSLI